MPTTPITFTGLWYSLWGHSDYTQTQYLDFTDIYGNLNSPDKDFEELRFNANPPDPTRMKQLVFVIENNQNPSTGAFYIDDIRFVDAGDYPFDPNQRTDDEFLDFVSQRTFLYFLDSYDPQTGLFRDRSTFPNLMSTAATGFGLTALAIGESRGWIMRPLAEEMVLRTLRTLRDGQTTTNTVTDTIAGTNGYKGYYYHFLGLDGLRKDTDSELSPVDTALLMAGVLTVREYFNDTPEIVSLSDELYRRVEWGWMVDQNLIVTSGTQTITNSRYNQFYLAWRPECGPNYNQSAPGGGCFSDFYWDYYTDEVILLNLLVIGSPTYPVTTDVFYAWFRDVASGTYAGYSLIPSWSGSFFTYVFARLWIDFSTLGKDNPPDPALQVDWGANSVEAAKASWQFVEDRREDTPCDGDENYTTYNLGGFLTASDGPNEAAPYKPYGTPPAGTAPITDRTVQAYGPGMAVMLLPDKAIPTLKRYFTDTDLWRYRFGFGDAYNLDPPDCNGPWYNHATFGIDQGPMLIAIENYRSGLVWNTIRRNSYIQRALCSIWGCLIYLPIVLK